VRLDGALQRGRHKIVSIDAGFEKIPSPFVFRENEKDASARFSRLEDVIRFCRADPFRSGLRKFVSALRDYKTGVRSGGSMAVTAYPLSEEEIAALAHYLAHL
jgi:hypothetical protein